MKTLKSTDLDPMVLNTMNNTVNFAAIRLSTPLNTAEIWGLGAAPGVDSAIWGTLGANAGQRTPPATAIWGTRPSNSTPPRTHMQKDSGMAWIS
jgi:hypothetical protein